MGKQGKPLEGPFLSPLCLKRSLNGGKRKFKNKGTSGELLLVFSQALLLNDALSFSSYETLQEQWAKMREPSQRCEEFSFSLGYQGCATMAFIAFASEQLFQSSAYLLHWTWHVEGTRKLSLPRSDSLRWMRPSQFPQNCQNGSYFFFLFCACACRLFGRTITSDVHVWLSELSIQVTSKKSMMQCALFRAGGTAQATRNIPSGLGEKVSPNMDNTFLLVLGESSIMYCLAQALNNMLLDEDSATNIAKWYRAMRKYSKAHLTLTWYTV